MPVEVKIPQLGESVTEGTVIEWRKAVGDAVQEGETLLEVTTDKVDVEIPSPAAGVESSRVRGIVRAGALDGRAAVQIGRAHV